MSSPKIELTDWQSDFITNPSRFRTAVCSRRSGKSLIDAAILYLHSVSHPNSNILYTAPTNMAARDIIWSQLVDGVMLKGAKQPPFFPKEIIKHRCNAVGDLRVELVNGSKIAVKGGENPDALLGQSLDLLILDEYQSMREDIYFKLRPSLADRKGKIVFTGTPRGFGNQLYDMYWNGAADNPDRLKDWYSVQVTAVDAGVLDLDEIEQARRDMSRKQFEQEFCATFLNPEGSVYPDFNPAIHVKGNFELPADKPILVGLDFNVSYMSAVLSFKHQGMLYVFDEIILTDTTTKEMAITIKKRFPDRKIVIHCDPSGSARDSTGLIDGLNDIIILENYFYSVEPPAKTLIEDRVNSVNWMLSDCNGVNRVQIHPRCKALSRALSSQAYAKNGKPEKDGKLDASTDSFGYLVLCQMPNRPTFTTGALSK